MKSLASDPFAEPHGPLDGVTSWHLSNLVHSVGLIERRSADEAELAASLLKRCLVLARVFSNTAGGRRWLESGPYRGLSAAFLYRLAIDDGALVGFCVDTVDAAYDRPETRRSAVLQMTPDYFEAIQWLLVEWDERRAEELPKIIIFLNSVIPDGSLRAVH